jgi:hypothetical protein
MQSLPDHQSGSNIKHRASLTDRISLLRVRSVDTFSDECSSTHSLLLAIAPPRGTHSTTHWKRSPGFAINEIAFSGVRHSWVTSPLGLVSVTRTPASVTPFKAHPLVHPTGHSPSQQPQPSKASVSVESPQVDHESDSPVKGAKTVRQSQSPSSPLRKAQSGSLALLSVHKRSTNVDSSIWPQSLPKSSFGYLKPPLL